MSFLTSLPQLVNFTASEADSEESAFYQHIKKRGGGTGYGVTSHGAGVREGRLVVAVWSVGWGPRLTQRNSGLCLPLEAVRFPQSAFIISCLLLDLTVILSRHS